MVSLSPFERSLPLNRRRRRRRGVRNANCIHYVCMHSQHQAWNWSHKSGTNEMHMALCPFETMQKRNPTLAIVCAADSRNNKTTEKIRDGEEKKPSVSLFALAAQVEANERKTIETELNEFKRAKNNTYVLSYVWHIRHSFRFAVLLLLLSLVYLAHSLWLPFCCWSVVCLSWCQTHINWLCVSQNRRRCE